MLKPVVAAAIVLAVAGGVAFWAYARGDDSAEAEPQVIRWINVTVEVPEDSGLTVTQSSFWRPESSTPALRISPLDRPKTSVFIDAETGAILYDNIQDEDRAAVDEVLKTVKVAPLDQSTAPWPYSGEPPNVPREEVGNISYIPPDPAAGIRITFQLGDPFTDGGNARPESSMSIHVTNGRSTFGIDAGTGKIYEETARILPADRDAFDRFLSAVQYEGRPLR